jgi:hypothetical protein
MQLVIGATGVVVFLASLGYDVLAMTQQLRN